MASSEIVPGSSQKFKMAIYRERRRQMIGSGSFRYNQTICKAGDIVSISATRAFPCGGSNLLSWPRYHVLVCPSEERTFISNRFSKKILFKTKNSHSYPMIIIVRIGQKSNTKSVIFLPISPLLTHNGILHKSALTLLWQMHNYQSFASILFDFFRFLSIFPT